MFDYKVYTYNNSYIYASDEHLEKELKELGEQGWELVSAIPEVSGDGSEGDLTVRTKDIKLIFKKAL
jgi:hypothetical protein